MTFSAVLCAVLAAPPSSWTFEQAVQQALEKNPALKSASAETARAFAQVEQARAPSLPALSVNSIYTHLDHDRVLAGRVIAAQNQLSGNAILSVPVFVPNRWAQWKRAAANEEAVKANSADARRQVALGAGRSWLSVLAQNKVVQAQQRGVEVAQAHLDYAHSRVQSGLGTRLDESRAAQELAVAKTQLASALGILARLQEQLGVAVGVDFALDAADAEPSLSALPSVAEAEEGARTVRTDVVAAQTRVEAAKTATSYDWTDYTPLLIALGQPGYQNPATPTAPRWNYQAQVVLSLPLYDGSLRYGQQKERRALLSQAQAQLESITRQAGAEVRAAYVQVQRADEALAAAKESEKEASAALVLSQSAFRAGGITNLEVIDAERRARDSQTNVALAENAARQARLELLSAGGRFP